MQVISVVYESINNFIYLIKCYLCNTKTNSLQLSSTQAILRISAMFSCKPQSCNLVSMPPLPYWTQSQLKGRTLFFFVIKYIFVKLRERDGQRVSSGRSLKDHL